MINTANFTGMPVLAGVQPGLAGTMTVVESVSATSG